MGIRIAPDLIRSTVKIASAYTSNNAVNPGELSALLHAVHGALAQIVSSNRVEDRRKFRRPTSEQIMRSITPDGLISFIDGKAYVSLGQHLAKHRMSFRAYCKKYDLPANYPRVVPGSVSLRQEVATNISFVRSHQPRGTRKQISGQVPSQA